MDPERLARGAALNDTAARLRRRLAPHWWTARARRPRLTAAIAAVGALLAGPSRLAARVQSLQARTHRLERDLELLSAQVAALAARPDTDRVPDREADLVAVRLGAIAFYEERIAALERRRAGRTRRREATGRDHPATIGGTAGE